MRLTSTIIVVLLMAAPLSLLLAHSNGDDRTRAGSEAYIIGPLEDITLIMEDDTYSSKYFAVMGDLAQYSLKDSPNWLSITTGPALTLNTNGLEARWTFDQRNADDTSGNGHHGTIHGAVADTGVFSMNSAMSFDGDDYIDIPHNDRLNITDEITVEAWIYPTFSDSGEHMIISKGGHWGDDDPQDYELTIDKDRPLFQIKIPGSNDWYGAAPAEPITKNTWHHVAGVYDGNIFKIFIDGINQTNLYNGWSGDYRGHIYTGGLPTSMDNISIGRRQPASWGSLFYEGRIDEVRIFDRALENKEILEHATRPGTNTLNLSGTPGNSVVGDHQVTLNITNGDGFYAERDFTITVQNVDPVIITEDLTGAVQDMEYSVDYDADEEGEGTTTWSFSTEASFLSMDPVTGLLSGTPANDDVGEYDVMVVFSDGNGGSDTHEFLLTVSDINDPPSIQTLSIPNATEDESYEIQFEGSDIDGEILNWTYEMDSDWLTGTSNGLLSGIPSNDDVGNYTIKVKAADPRGLYAEEEYLISVINVNDEPEWIDVPDYVKIDEGETFIFDINATDVDIGDVVSYSVITSHETNLSIDEDGVIAWIASRIPFESEPYNLTVKVEITDGKAILSHFFYIEVIPNNSPETVLLSPANDAVINENSTDLSWTFDDDDGGNPVYRVYFSDTRGDVTTLDEDVIIQTKEPHITISDLERGTSYYWTVIAWDGFSNGTCLNETFSFYVNSIPTTDLLLPGNGGRTSSSMVALSWNGFDLETEGMAYTVYLTEDETKIGDLDPSVIHSSGLNDIGVVLTDLSPGTTYYWTVIPDDGNGKGVCHSGIWSFVTNSLPVIDPVEDIISTGSDRISIDINATDDEGVEFSLVYPEEGMFINEDTGVFIWIPKEGQVGTFNVTVKVSDGMDDVILEFTITVNEKDEKDEEDDGGVSILIILLILGAIIIIIAVVILLLFLRRKKGREPEEEQITENEGVPPEHGGSTISPVEGSEPISGPITIEDQASVMGSAEAVPIQPETVQEPVQQKPQYEEIPDRSQLNEAQQEPQQQKIDPQPQPRPVVDTDPVAEDTPVIRQENPIQTTSTS